MDQGQALKPGAVFVVTGASAGCGKTVFSAALVRALRAGGVRACAVKPVETGCTKDERHDIETRDGEVLHAASPEVPKPIVAPYRFVGQAPAPRAADQAGLELRLSDLTDAVRAAREYGDVLVVECEGGALEPIAVDGSPLDLAAELSASLVVCARASEPSESISAIVSAAREKDMDVACLAISGAAELTADPAQRLRDETGARVLELPHVEGPSERVSSALAETIADGVVEISDRVV